MGIPFLRRKPGYEASLYCEAQALVDDGLDPAFVASLYPDDADWLEPLLATADTLAGAFAADEPSYYFEASLKHRFVSGELAAEPVALPARPAPRPGMLTGLASSAVVAIVAGLGVLTYGFVTAQNAVPGDWNYAFKLAGERFEYSLTRGDERIDVQLQHAEARIYEIQRLSEEGRLTGGSIAKLTRELGSLYDLVRTNELNAVQAAKVNSIRESTVALLGETEGELADEADRAITTANDVAAAASGGVGSLPSPEPTLTPTPEPAATSTPAPEPSPTEEPTPAPTEEPTREPTSEPTPEPTPEPTEEPTADPTDPPADPTGTAEPAEGGAAPPAPPAEGTTTE